MSKKRALGKSVAVQRLLMALLVAYIVSFAVWRYVAVRRAEHYGLSGYYFFLESFDRNPGPERAARIFYFPLVLIDVKVLGNDPPGSAPLKDLY